MKEMLEKSGFTTSAIKYKRANGKTDEEILAEGLKRKEIGQVHARRLGEIMGRLEEGGSVDGGPEAEENYARATLREKIASANKRELEEGMMRKELVRVADVAEEWARVGARLKDELLAIPDRVALGLDGRPYKEIREILMQEIRRVLIGLAGEVEQGGLGEGRGEQAEQHVEPTEEEEAVPEVVPEVVENDRLDPSLLGAAAALRDLLGAQGGA